MGILTGFIEGVIKFDSNGDKLILPFQDTVEEASFNYTSTNIFVETFGADGTKGRSDSCPYMRQCSFGLTSKNISWALMQAVTNTMAGDASRTLPAAQSYVVTAAQITSGVATFEVAWTPAVGEDIIASDGDGLNYPITFDTGEVTIGSVGVPIVAGTKVTISYRVAPTGTNNEIIIGDAGVLLGEIGLYGRFYGCPQTLLVEVPRAVIESNVEMGVGSDAASVGFTASALRNSAGEYAVITRI